MYFDLQQKSDDLPCRPRYLEFSLGLLVGNLSGHEFDLKDEVRIILANIRKTPLICICSPLLNLLNFPPPPPFTFHDCPLNQM